MYFAYKIASRNTSKELNLDLPRLYSELFMSQTGNDFFLWYVRKGHFDFYQMQSNIVGIDT